MKIKYEVEADACGFVERCFVDGELKNECRHENTVGGTRRVSGEDWENVFEDYELVDAFESFFGFNLFLICNKAEE